MLNPACAHQTTQYELQYVPQWNSASCLTVYNPNGSMQSMKENLLQCYQMTIIPWCNISQLNYNTGSVSDHTTPFPPHTKFNWPHHRHVVILTSKSQQLDSRKSNMLQKHAASWTAVSKSTHCTGHCWSDRWEWAWWLWWWQELSHPLTSLPQFEAPLEHLTTSRSKSSCKGEQSQRNFSKH